MTNSYVADVYQRQLATWGLLPHAVRAKIVKDTKKSIKKLMRANGYKEDKESREALEDPDAKEYLGHEISGDESDSDSDATVLGDDGDVEDENAEGEDAEVPKGGAGQENAGEAEEGEGQRGESREVGSEEVAAEGVGKRD